MINLSLYQGYKKDSVKESQSLTSLSRYVWSLIITGHHLESHLDFFKDMLGHIGYILEENTLYIFYFESYLDNIEDTLKLYSEDQFEDVTIDILPKIKSSKVQDIESLKELYRKIHNEQSVYSLRELALGLIKNDNGDIKVAADIIFDSLGGIGEVSNIIVSMAECNLNVSKASDMCYLHRNTMNNKIEAMKQALYLTPQSFKDEMSLILYIKQ